MKKNIILIFISLATFIHAKDLKTIINSNRTKTWMIDKDKIISIEPYNFYESWGEKILIKNGDEPWINRHKIKTYVGTKITFDSDKNSINMSNGGSGIISGGDAKIDNKPFYIILDEISSLEVVSQLK
jgi:hypothetical protein